MLTGIIKFTDGLTHRRSIAPTARPQAVRRAVQVDASKAKFFVGGNWKANGTLDSISQLCQVGR